MVIEGVVPVVTSRNVIRRMPERRRATEVTHEDVEALVKGAERQPVRRSLSHEAV